MYDIYDMYDMYDMYKYILDMNKYILYYLCH